MRNLVTLILVLLNISVVAQTHLWRQVKGGMDHFVNHMYLDEVDQKIYMIGYFYYADTLLVNQSCTWDGDNFGKMGDGIGGNDWCDSIPYMCNQLTKAVKFDNKVFVGGPQYNWDSSGGYYQKFLHHFDGVSWDTSGLDDHAYLPVVANNELFVLGDYDDTYDSLAPQYIRHWNGTNWEPFAPNGNYAGWYTYALVYYQNQYYLGGNFPEEIIRWDGQAWNGLGEGVKGSWAHVTNLVEYKGLLYVGGYFYEQDGNYDDFVQVWDGSQWYESFPDVQFTTGTRQVAVYDGELYIVANHYVNDNGVWKGPFGAARYDGHSFCSFHNMADNNWVLRQVVKLNGKLYGAVPYEQGLDTMRCFAEYIGGPQDEVCIVQDLPTARTTPIPSLMAKISPNPSQGRARMEGWLPKGTIIRVEIMDVQGRRVKEMDLGYQPAGNWESELNMEGYGKGIYFLQILTDIGTTTLKHVVE